MERYNFQINHPKNRKDWDKITIHTRLFARRQNAIALARRVARRYKTEVRVTTGPYPLKASGHYIRAGD